MRARLSKLVAGVAMVAALAFGGSALASTGGNAQAAGSQVQRTALHTVSARSAAQDGNGSEQQGESGVATESGSDAAAQASACQKAGIDPNGSNVQYDDQTGTCSLDTGGGAN